MRVLVDAVGIRSSGGANFFIELLKYFPVARPGWTWEVFMLDRSARRFELPVLPGSVRVHAAAHGSSWPGRIWWLYRGLASEARACGAGGILNLTGAGCLAPEVPQVNLLLNAKAVSTLPRFGESPMQHVRLKALRWAVLRSASASAVAVQTEVMREAIVGLAPALADRVHVVCPGGLPSTFGAEAPSERLQCLLREVSRPALVYVSHPWSHKNHANLIRAMPGILEELPGATLLLTLALHSELTPSYEEDVARLRDLSEALGVARRVIFTGILDAADIHGLLAGSDLCVYPSFLETGAGGIIEAIGAGCPVAAADLPYAREIAGEAAVYFDPYSPDDIRRTVVELCREDARRSRLVAAGERLKPKFSFDRMGEDLLTILDGLL